MHPFFFRFFNINALKEKNDKDYECESETTSSVQAESGEDKASLGSSNETSQNTPKGEDNPSLSVASSTVSSEATVANAVS